MVSLMIPVGDGKYASCGASLINDRYVLTASHCLAHAHNASQVMLTLFAHTTQDRIKLPKLKVDSLIKNPHWGKPGYSQHHDLSLIKLAEVQVFDETFSPICLPPKNSSWLDKHSNLINNKNKMPHIKRIMTKDGNHTMVRRAASTSSKTETVAPVLSVQQSGEGSKSLLSTAFVTGWGHQSKWGFKVKASALYEAETEIHEDEACRDAWHENFDPKFEMCAGTGACQGDSGGPLAVRQKGIVTQIGVVSYGPRTCNVNVYVGPTVYEKISAHWDFIEENTRDARWCSRP